MTTEQETKKKTFRPKVIGATYAGTIAGFKEFVVKANEADEAGYSLVTLVKLDNKLAAVWKLRSGITSDDPYVSFLGEEDEEPIPNYGY